MGRLVNFIYGGLIIAVVITTWLGIFPQVFLPFVVIILGGLILFTPVDTPSAMHPLAPRTPRGPFQWLRRYVFGAYMVLAGVMSYVDILSNFPWLARTSIYTFSGQLILLGIGAIYFLSAFSRTRRMVMASV